jgi:hypothetical protein
MGLCQSESEEDIVGSDCCDGYLIYWVKIFTFNKAVYSHRDLLNENNAAERFPWRRYYRVDPL